MPFDSPLWTDAVGWPDTITVSITASYDDTADDGTQTTISGSATFTYTRASLGDSIASPALPSTGPGSAVNKAEFLPLQCAIGKMPGWSVSFGEQDPVKKAFTTTITSPADEHGHVPPPTVLHNDATCGMSMLCASCAPGRFTVGSDEIASLHGINAGLIFDSSPANKRVDAQYSLELLYAGAPASGNTAAIGKVYRITLPGDAQSILSLSIDRNGVSHTVHPTLGDASADGIAYYLYAKGYQRTPYVFDLWMHDYADTLGAGKISYYAGGSPTPAQSYLSVNTRTKVLANPFALIGQTISFEAEAGDFGYSIEVSY